MALEGRLDRQRDRLNAIQYFYAKAAGGEFCCLHPLCDSGDPPEPSLEPTALIQTLAPQMAYARQQAFAISRHRRCDLLLQIIMEVAIAELLCDRQTVINDYLAITKSFYLGDEPKLLHGVLKAAIAKHRRA